MNKTRTLIVLELGSNRVDSVYAAPRSDATAKREKKLVSENIGGGLATSMAQRRAGSLGQSLLRQKKKYYHTNIRGVTRCEVLHTSLKLGNA